VEKAIERRNRELALLNRVIAAATSELEFERVLEVTCRELALAFDVAEAAAVLLNDERTAVTVVAGYQAEGSLSAVGDVIPLEGNPAAHYILKHRKPLVTADVQSDPRIGPARELAKRHDIASLLILPLAVRNEAIGFVSLGTTERREFSDREIGLAANAITAVAQVLDNARLFEGERRQRQVAETLLETSEAVTSLDLGRVLLTLADQLLDVSRFHVCVIYEYDREAKQIRTLVERARAVWPPGSGGEPYRLSDHPTTERVLITSEPEVVHVGMDDPELTWMGEMGLAALLILPLRAGEETIGLAEVVSPKVELASDGAAMLCCQQVLQEAASWLKSPLWDNSGAVLLALASRLAEASGSTHCALSAWHRAEGEVRATVEYNDAMWSFGEGPVYRLADYPSDARAVEYGISTVVRLSDFTLASADRNELVEWGAHTLVTQPLSIRGRAIGVIGLYDVAEVRIISDDELRLWRAVGDQAAVAIENARLYEQAQQEIAERARAEEQVRASLQEKEVLLKEIHHRVKNNLQAVASLLYLQSKSVKDEEIREMFHESRSRIRSMALSHERLYQSQDLARVDFAEYARNLTHHLFRSYGVDPDVIKLKINAEDIFLGIDTAVPCGLIINELVSNSLKHAFPDGTAGEVRIELRADHNGGLTLVVSDDGVGLPEDLEFRDAESLGLQLVNNLSVAQLGGTIELDRSGGTAFKITFTDLK
jgi:two-component sensor histidine kinase